MLREDTRVTNHGFSGGEATPRQSVLQAGTAVLADNRGVPRVRCSCGNPLSEPAPVDNATTLRGDAWAGFDERRVLTVVPAGTALATLVLVNLVTGQTYPVSIGTTGPVTTTTMPPAQRGLELRPDGLGIATFGQPGDEVRAVLTRRFGEPVSTDECNFGNSSASCSPAYPQGTSVRWPAISIFIDLVTGEFMQYQVFTREGQVAPPASTPEDISVGSTRAELSAAYPGLLAYECDEDYVAVITPAVGAADGTFWSGPRVDSGDGFAFGVSNGLVTSISHEAARPEGGSFWSCI